MNVWELKMSQAGRQDANRHAPKPKTASSSKAGSFDTGALKENPETALFPHVLSNSLEDGYLGVAPAKSFPPNAYGLYNMLGNVWEWVAGGSPKERILRGGSFIDSVDGSFNHIVLVSATLLAPLCSSWIS